MKTTKAVIMAGGQGTRLGNLVREIPKPMVKVAGKAILERQIESLKEFGIIDITIVVGYLGDIIKNYFKDGKDFGVNIDYISETSPLGSAGSLYFLKDKFNDDFVLLFGDLIESVNFEKMVQFHKQKKALMTLFSHPNSHPFDSDLIIADENDVVLGIDSKHNIRDYYYHNLVNAGIYVLSPKSLEFFNEIKKQDMEKEFIKSLIPTNCVFSYASSEYVKDAGTIERLASVENDIVNGVVESKNTKHFQKAIFLDRDGTINVHKGHMSDINKFELVEDAAKAIKMINESGYLAIVITNQPVVARGEISLEGLKEIHKKLETLLGKEGAYLDAIYFCPHYPESGFLGEVKELKIECECRKPKIGLLLKAKERFNIDLTKSWFIGDSDLDIECGQNAENKTILIKTFKETLSKPDYVADSLLDAVKISLNVK